MDRTFDVDNVILTRVEENDLKSYLIDSDIDDDGNNVFRFPEFASAIVNTIPEYVFAEYLGTGGISQNQIVRRLKEAAKSIYKIEEYELMRKACLLNDTSAQAKLNSMPYQKRGEFGELLLHLLLRDFHGTIPLISKAYFKDSAGVPAHGFDAIHISPKEKILWLGESKLYGDSKSGIIALIKDIKEHFCKNYLNEQMAIIKKNLECNKIPQRDEWIDYLNKATKLSDAVNIINIPLLCTYPHDIYNLYSDMSCDEAIAYHETDVRGLKEYFDKNNDHNLKGKLNIILMLLPIQNKTEFVKMLHTKLWHMQNM
jgi:hypothetical protein